MSIHEGTFLSPLFCLLEVRSNPFDKRVEEKTIEPMVPVKVG